MVIKGSEREQREDRLATILSQHDKLMKKSRLGEAGASSSFHGRRLTSRASRGTISLGKETTEMNCKRSVRNQVIWRPGRWRDWRTGGCFLVLALWLSLQAISTAGLAATNQRRNQQVQGYHSGARDDENVSQHGGAQTKQRQINWLPAAHSNSHQPQVAAKLASSAEAKQNKGKKAKLDSQDASDKLKKFDHLMNVAAQASRVGALASDGEQTEQPERKRHKGVNGTRGATVVEFEPTELAKSMQMMSAAIASADGPTQNSAQDKASIRRAGQPKASARQQAAGASMIANETSDEFASGFDEHSLVPPPPPPPPNRLIPPPESILPGSIELDEAHQVQQQHSVIEQEPEQRVHQEREHHVHQAVHNQLPHHGQGPPLLHDFHVVNSLPDALHDDHLSHRHEHLQGSNYRADSSGYSPGAASHMGKAGSIRVVFNNNPQFIIGSRTRDLPASDLHSGGLASSASSPLQRASRQPSSTLYDEYSQDESVVDETKAIPAPCADKSHHQHQHQEQQQQHDEQVNELPKNMEKIDTKADLAPPIGQKPLLAAPPSKTKTTQVEEPQQAQEYIPAEPKQPPVKSRSPPVVETQQQQQVDEQVVTPFDQILKSGLRPPLRMVISMRNKQGNVMKVPINFHGGSTKSPQEPVDFPQMQIRFEKPVIEQAQQTIRDENTPIGGDIFDPTLTKPFEKTSPAKRPAKTSFEAQQQQQQEASFEPAIKGQMRVRSKEAPVKLAPEVIPQIVEPTPAKTPTQVAIAPQVKEEPLTPVVEQKTAPAEKKGDCEHKSEPRPIGQKTHVEEPPIKQQAVLPQVITEQPEQQHEQQQHIVLPISSDPNEGVVQMLMPKLAQFQNKTFANMLTQFQQALSEQMTNHLANEQHKEATAQERKRPNVSKTLDDQEDLMMALMAANLNQRGGASGGAADRAELPLSMTVIKPPKGTSLEEAIRRHAKAGQTMAIIGSPALMESINQAEGGQHSNGPGEISNEALPVGVGVQVRPVPGDGQRVNARPRTRPPGTNINSGPVSDDREIDPDGFSSSASSSASGTDSSSIAALESADFESPDRLLERSFWARQLLAKRFKRSAPAADGKSTIAQEVGHLEPEDKLANPTKSAPVSRPKKEQQRKVVDTKRARRTREGSSNKGELSKAARSRSRASKTQTASHFSKRLGNFRPSGRLVSGSNQAQQRDKSMAKDKRRHDEQDFQTASSQVNEVSSEPSGDESGEDADEEGGGDGSDSSPDSSSVQSSSSSADREEPSASASGEGDDTDYTGDLADDFEDSASASSFDNDDEPYNQAAASDRDYSGASSSFEIPAIDINPNTLQQKGCRTVLREVQEIPMNGLGVVQANGQPGSGFASAEGSSVGPVRVRRQAPNQKLINSRKVTSIVMTKECHFPNDGGAPSATEAPATSTKRAREVARSPEAGKQTQLDFGSQSGASQNSAAVAAHRPSDQQPPPRQVAVQSYPTYQLLKEPVQPQHQKHKQARVTARPEVAKFYQQPAQLLLHQAVRPQSGPARYLQHQEQPTSRQQLVALANFYAAQQQLANEKQRRRKVAATPQQQIQPSASSIRRRSVAPMPVQQQQQQQPQSLPEKRSAPRAAGQGRDLNESAASGVIAQKLYKPPSEDDPYHTLSYSSQTGADPDMEEDEDDSVVMGADGGEQQDSAESGRSDERRPRVSSSQGTLSERERAALMDPNHDDTDPESEEEAAQRRGRASAPSSDQQRDSQRRDGNQIQGSEDADENEGDLTDESRPAQRIQQVPRARSSEPIKRLQSSRAAPVKGKASQNVRSAQRATIRAPASRSADRRALVSSSVKTPPARRAASQEPARFGKSFKFEHELSRVGPASAQPAVGGHLRQLKTGLQGYVAQRGELDRQPVARPLESATQLRSALASTLERRLDDDDDEADAEETDDDEREGRASSGRRRMAASPSGAADDSDEDDENPDADPELNPRESHLPANSKPKRFEKSFAYVHRDLPKKGARNPDDFVVSYGRGNLQTEHEDYDSDRDQNAAPSQAAEQRDRATAPSAGRAHSVSRGATPDRRTELAGQFAASRRPGQLSDARPTPGGNQKVGPTKRQEQALLQ